MDKNTDWTATALFSPSKALAQQAQAKDWASVDSWLSKRYASKRLPPFERNEDTLQALLALATLNEGADEQRTLIDRVEKIALQSLLKRPSSDVDEDLRGLFQELNGNEALSALAESAVSLDTSATDISALGEAVADLTSQKFTVDQDLHRAGDRLRALKSEQRKALELLKNLKSESFQPPSDLVEQTSEWTRNTKHLKAKIGEYEDRLKGLRAATQPKVTLEDVLEQAQDLSSQQARLAKLDVQLNAFQSLPSDSKAARAKLESSRELLRKLIKKRDEHFEQLVEGGG